MELQPVHIPDVSRLLGESYVVCFVKKILLFSTESKVTNAGLVQEALKSELNCKSGVKDQTR